MWDMLCILSLACPALGKMSGFIVGGHQATIKDWPFIAYLYIYNASGQIASCGGSLISSQTVLTAAHCLDDITKKKEYGVVSYDILMGHTSYNKAIMRRTVLEYRTHEKYDTDGTMHDIGVIIMTHPVDFHRTVKKVVLMTPQMRQNMDNGDLVVAGWGRTGEEEPSSVMLKELKQTLLPQNMCYSYINDDRDPGIICGGRVNDSNYAYSGDSGGPLAQKHKQYLAGLVSWRIESHGFTVYTSVPYYYSWIETTQSSMYHDQCSRRNTRKTNL